MSLRTLGKASGLTAGFLCDLEHGKRGVSIEHAKLIARALGVSVSSLAGESGPEPTSIRALADSARTIAKWLEWERESLEDFHAYAQKFGGKPGANVYEFALRDALVARGLTLEQFRSERDGKAA